MRILRATLLAVAASALLLAPMAQAKVSAANDARAQVSATSARILADAPPVPAPTCVACPAGYHCVHNPEGCESDNPPPKKSENNE